MENREAGRNVNIGNHVETGMTKLDQQINGIRNNSFTLNEQQQQQQKDHSEVRIHFRPICPERSPKMAPRKRNLRLNEQSDETVTNRRSSLQVNLSFVTNLSDSGNGSFKSQLENNEDTVTKRIYKNRVDAMTNIPEKVNSAVDVEDKSLSVIKIKEQALSESCKLLKDAILHKTREIFDQSAELAVKTTSVLRGRRQILKEINDDSRSVNYSLRSNASKNNLVETSFGSESTMARKKSIKMGTISKGNDSIILGGSAKSHRKFLSKVNKKVLIVRLNRIADPRLEISSASSQSSQLSSLDDIGAPMTCSSFISGHENPESENSQRDEKEDREDSEKCDVEDAAAAGRSVETLTPVEITAVRIPVLSNKKPFTRLKLFSSNDAASRIEKTTDRSFHGEIPMELTTVQSHIPFRDSASSSNTVRTSLNVNTSNNESSGITKRISEGPLSNRENISNRLSLRVNTSLRSQRQSIIRETIDNNLGRTEISMLKNMEKSVDDCNEYNSDTMENMSLIARLRNISAKRATEAVERRKSNGTNRSSLIEGPSFVEGTPYPPSRSILWRTQIKSATLNAIRNRTKRKAPAPVTPEKKSSRLSDSDSSSSTEYLTPPNTTTVVLDDSPCRFMASTGNTQVIPDSSDEDVPMEDLPKDNQKNLQEDHQKDLPIENSTEVPNDSSSEMSKNLSKAVSKDNANISRTRKKRLLPLCENLELVSFSPVATALSPPKKPIIRRKRFQKRKAARAVAAKRIQSMYEEDDDEPGSSNVNNIFTGQEKKKTKKPRKILSKKIVAKKIVGRDILEGLENPRCNGSDRDSTAGRSSLNDFSKKKTVPISGRNTKSQKLVIVATGFSKGDVDLVKKVVKELGGAELSSTVSRRTTHVVSTGVRTINLLRGIIRGCWLVSIEWVLKSLEKQKWINAEPYEMVHFSKAVQENRRDRQLFGKAYVPELFTTCGPIYIEHGTTPPPEILKELVKTAGGRIAEYIKDSKLSVGSEGLREIWILDSITTGDLQPLDDYHRR